MRMLKGGKLNQSGKVNMLLETSLDIKNWKSSAFHLSTIQMQFILMEENLLTCR